MMHTWRTLLQMQITKPPTLHPLTPGDTRKEKKATQNNLTNKQSEVLISVQAPKPVLTTHGC